MCLLWSLTNETSLGSKWNDCISSLSFRTQSGKLKLGTILWTEDDGSPYFCNHSTEFELDRRKSQTARGWRWQSEHLSQWGNQGAQPGQGANSSSPRLEWDWRRQWEHLSLWGNQGPKSSSARLEWVESWIICSITGPEVFQKSIDSISSTLDPTQSDTREVIMKLECRLKCFLTIWWNNFGECCK